MSLPNQKRAQVLQWLPVGMVAVQPPSPEAVTIPAGAAGTIKNFVLGVRPLLNLAGNDIGGYGDSSVVLDTETVFTNEVEFGTPDASLANGDYYINYLTGQGRGKKNGTGTTQHFTYSYFSLKTDETGSTTAVLEPSVFTSAAKTVTTVGTGNAEAVAANAGRGLLIVGSLSTNTGRIHLAFGAAPAAVGEGIELEPGDSILINWTEESLNAISDTAAQSLWIQEFNQ